MISQLQILRNYEINTALNFLVKKFSVELKQLSILEIGPGNLPINKFKPEVFTDYLGLEINEDYLQKDIILNTSENIKKLKDFDLIFSSSSVYYLEDCVDLLKSIDTQRKSVEVHIIPTASWRIYTQLSVYLSKLKRKNKLENTADSINNDRKLIDLFFLKSHHFNVNRFSEFYFYRKKYWEEKFSHTEKSLVSLNSNIFYTGKNILGKNLSIKNRKLLSKFLGSSSRIYFLFPIEDLKNYDK